MTAKAMPAAAWAEVRWWLALVVRTARRLPGQAAVVVAALWLFGSRVPLWGYVAIVVVASVLRAWALTAPLGFRRAVVEPIRGLWRRAWIRRHWAQLAVACGLSQTVRQSRGEELVRSVAVPRLTRVRVDGSRLVLRIRPLMGQTVETFAGAAEQLRMGVGATRVRTDPDGVNGVAMAFTIGDTLGDPFRADRPRHNGASIDQVALGRCEDGATWWVPVGPHTLVAGTSGAGKGSVFWSFVFGLAPLVRQGLVQLHGIDLKGGMEILMGAELFTSRATDAGEAVALLEDLTGDMRRRTRSYAGRVRSHAATVDEPLHVVMIDELAALTAYCPDRDLQRRAEMAVNLLCSQGRAPGFVVFACLQDPRKEVIPSRGLFTQMVGLRLKDVSETSMVLGEMAVSSGAQCHRIPRTMPGVGYVVPEEGGFPVRVRAGFVSDAEIRSVAREFATPTHRDVAPAPAALDSSGTARRPRPPRGSEVA